MGFIIAAGVIGIISIILLITGRICLKEGLQFEANKCVGKAEVVGYSANREHDDFDLVIKVLDLDDGKEYHVASNIGNTKDYPIGAIIDVLYAPIKSLVFFSTVEVHLLDNPPLSAIKLGRIIKCIANTLLIIASILTVIGIITVI